MALRIRDWDRYFENSASRKLKRLEWVAIPNKMDGSGYTALVDHPDGCAHLGAWYAIVEIASRREIRGTLPDGLWKNPHDVAGICQSLGRISRLPWSIFMDVIPRLLEIGWLEEFNIPQPSQIHEVTGKSAESADVVAESADVVADWRRHIEGKGREGKGRELQRTGNGISPPPPLPSVSEFPLSRAELRKRDPAVDDVFVRRLAQETAQFLISQDDMAPFDDEDLAKAIRESYATYTGRNIHGNGLLLSRVPRIIHGWGAKNGTT